MNHRPIYTVIISFLALVILASVANAQSKDRDNPTQLTSGEISGSISDENKGNFYYYKFIANPGEITITLTVQSDPPSNTPASVQGASFTLYDRDAKDILSKTVTASYLGGAGQAVGRVNITRRQTVVLGIGISEFISGTGKYRVRVSGAVEFGDDSSTSSSKDKR